MLSANLSNRKFVNNAIHLQDLAFTYKHCFDRVKQAPELYTNCAQNAPKVAIMRCKIEKISGEGALPPQALPEGRGHPLPTPHPSAPSACLLSF